MQEQLAETIRRSVRDCQVLVQSDDGTHFTAIVVSEAFEGMPLVRQHQMVMKALKEEFDSERLHALQLRTFTPAAWAALQARPLRTV